MSFKGSNKLGAKETFVSRVLYECYAYSKDGASNVNPEKTKNLLFLEKQLHGKVNQYMYPISPHYRKMVNISANLTSPVLVFDFVADAFKALQEEFRRALSREEIFVDGNIGDPRSGLTPKLGAISTDSNYLGYAKKINDNFLEAFTKKETVDSFETFMPVYMDYLKTAASRIPFTRGAYITSKYNSRMNSGLYIEIASHDHSLDADKYDLYINDKNFKYYQIAAAKHGFMIDKHAPWRLIADFNPNSQMYIYAKNRNSSLSSIDDILGFYYRLSYHDELEDFKKTAISAYSTFARSNPVMYRTRREGGCKITETITPQIENTTDLMEKYQDSFWLENYIILRNLESKLDYPEATLNKIIKYAKELEKTVDIRKALGYIERKFNGFMHREGSMCYEAAKIDLKEADKTPASFSKELKSAVRISKTKVY